jgi:competence protein ComEC
MANLKISVLDVGHGDFIYVETPLGQNLVIDCGSGEETQPGKFLNKITTISEVQISHPHTDHFRDLPALSSKKIQSFRSVNLSGFTDEVIGWRYNDKSAIAMLRKLSSTIQTDNAAVTSGSGFNHIVFSPKRIDYKDPNTASMVTLLQHGTFKMLFGADLPTEGWTQFLKDPNFKKAITGTTVLKVSHHGRTVGCSEDLFEIISPKLCIISDKAIESDNENTVETDWYCKRTSGAIVNFGNQTTTRKVLTTRCDGSVYISVDGDGMWTVFGNTSWRND